MKLKRSDHPWLVFLRARAEVIQLFLTDQYTFAEIAQKLSMDATQVELIAATPIEGIGMVADTSEEGAVKS